MIRRYKAVKSPYAMQDQYVEEKLPVGTDGASALVRFLLETMRREMALGQLGKVDLRSTWIWVKNYAQHRSFSLHPGADCTHGWLTGEGTKQTQPQDYG